MENRTSSSAVDPSSWQRVLAILRPRVGREPFETWFLPTRLLGRRGPTLRVRVPNDMFAEWLRTQYLTDIRCALGEAGLTDIENVEFLSNVPKDEPPRVTAGHATTARDDRAAPHAPPRRRPPDEADPRRGRPESGPIAREASSRARDVTPVRSQLNSRYTFDNLVVSSCNQFAHAAAVNVSENPGQAYNPLFLYGGVGLGKTHVMQAIGDAVLSKREDADVRYRTSEQFMNELITAIRFEDTQSFRDRYRTVDVLLIDDVQFLAGKESTQEEFFHTFNALYDAGRQIVLTSDCPPRSIPSLEERLRSRFEWGLLADLQPPDLETKVAILNKMASAKQLTIPAEVALFLASNVHTNVRELEGSLTTLIAASSIQRRPLDLALAREVMRTLAPADREPVTIDAILRVVARHFNLKVSDLRARTNARRITYPRQIAMYLAKNLARESLPTIGQLIGGKHHTTVLHSVRKIGKEIREDPSVEKLIARLAEELGA